VKMHIPYIFMMPAARAAAARLLLDCVANPQRRIEVADLEPDPPQPPSPEADLPQDLSPGPGSLRWWYGPHSSLPAPAHCFFSLYCPVDLIGEEPQSGFMDHLSVYTLGFIGFWCVGALASAVALYLVRTPPGAPPTEPNIG